MDFSGNDNSLPPQPFDVSDSHLIRNEVNRTISRKKNIMVSKFTEGYTSIFLPKLGTAQRLKRRWTLGLGMVGAVALVSLALVIAMAVKGTGRLTKSRNEREEKNGEEHE